MTFYAWVPTGTPTEASRETGPPQSSNGASSMSTFFDDLLCTEASARLLVLSNPSPAELVYWAFQVSFADAGGAVLGAAHLGLQFYPSYPGSTAVNWGGYLSSNGAELGGTVSQLPSALNNPNTRNYSWVRGRFYRLRVWVPSPGVFRGEVTDTVSGVSTVVRDLFLPGASLLREALVFTESFAVCQARSGCEWSQVRVTQPAGGQVSLTSGTVGYQSFANGGCTNTNQSTEGPFLYHECGVPRVTPDGAVLTF